MRFLFITLFLVVSIKIFSQKTIDSLKKQLAIQKSDTAKLRVYTQLSDVCSEEEIDKYTSPGLTIGNRLFSQLFDTTLKVKNTDISEQKLFVNQKRLLEYYCNLLNNHGVFELTKGNNLGAIKSYEKALKIQTYLNDSMRIANTLTNLGSNYYLIGDTKKANMAFSEALKIHNTHNDKKGIALCYNGLSIVSRQEGNLQKSIDYALIALKINEAQKDSAELANLYTTLSTYYLDIEYYDKALEYCNKSIAISKAIKYKRAEASAYNGLGYIYKVKKNLSKSLEYVLLGLKINQEVGDKNQIITSLNNIGVLYKDLKKYNVAIEYHTKSLALAVEINAQNEIANSYNKLAEVNFILNNVDKALEYAEKALEINKKYNSISDMINTYAVLKDVYAKKNKYKEAFEYTNLYVKLKDSLNSKDLKSKVLQKQFKYDYDKKVLTDSVKNSEQKKTAFEKIAYQTKEIKQQTLIKYILFGGIFIIAIFSVLIFNRLRVTSKQKQIIEKQRNELEIINKNINDSIESAQEIQSIIFPSDNELKTVFKNYVLLFKPYDKLSGDFIWLAQLNDNIVLIVADCTGHGVPGSLLTLLINELLNNIVKQNKTLEPELILREVNNQIYDYNSKKKNDAKTINQSADIGICLINHTHNTFKFSGSKANLYLVNNLNEVNYINSDSFEIGKEQNLKQVSSYRCELTEIKSIYLITDGIKDQLKYKTNKTKFGFKGFENFITDNHQLTAEEQQKNLENLYNAATNNHPQIDDITVFGFKI